MVLPRNGPPRNGPPRYQEIALRANAALAFVDAERAKLLLLRAELAVVELLISSTPPGATISVGKKWLDVAPATVPLVVAGSDALAVVTSEGSATPRRVDEVDLDAPVASGLQR